MSGTHYVLFTHFALPLIYLSCLLLPYLHTMTSSTVSPALDMQLKYPLFAEQRIMDSFVSGRELCTARDEFSCWRTISNSTDWGHEPVQTGLMNQYSTDRVFGSAGRLVEVWDRQHPTRAHIL